MQRFFSVTCTIPRVAIAMSAKDETDLAISRPRRVFGDGSHIIDELLFERAIALRRFPVLWKAITYWFLPLVKYQDAIDWADRVGHLDGREAFEEFADWLDLDIRVTGLQHLPRTGRVLIVANHPSGVVDSLAVYRAIGDIRPDTCCFSNRDIVRIIPRIERFIIPIEWMRQRRSPSALRETHAALKAAFAAERPVIIFPSGGIARGSLRGLQELDWLTATIKFVRRYNCPVLPLHIRARNSFLYYALEVIHDELRDLLRFREIMGKRHKRFDLTFGPVILPDHITGSAEEATAALKAHVEHDMTRGAAWPAPPAPTRTPDGRMPA